MGLGQLLLVGGGCSSLVVIMRPSPRWRVAVMAASAFALMGSTVVLALALMGRDFGYAYVADVTRREASGPYRLAGLWAGMAGSLLLWTTLIAVVSAVSAWLLVRRRSPLAPAVTAVGAATTVAMAGVVAFVASPFDRLPAPAIDGGGLTPILEHPAMLVHPPLIYLGLVLTLPPFALTVAALWRGVLDDEWVRLTRAALLLAWAVLTVGIALGSNWAYVELGWGGYWAWDQVENGSLLPWLAVAAAIHALARPRPGRGAAAAVLATFLLTGIGAAVTRSGTTGSVHSFAEATGVGRAMAAIGLGTAALSAGAMVRHARRSGPGSTAPPGSRRIWGTWARHSAISCPTSGTGDHAGTRDTEQPSWLSVSIAGLAAIALVVAIGTLTPVLAGWFGGDERATNGTFYARLCAPMAVALLLALASRPGSRARIVGPTAGLLTLAALVVSGRPAWPALLIGAAVAAGVRSVAGLRRHRHEAIHLGLAVMVLAVGATALGTVRTVWLGPGASTEVAGRRLELIGTRVLPGAGAEQRLLAEITFDGVSLRPELRIDERRALATSESALDSTPWRDLQITVRDVTADGSVVADVSVRPLAWWLWWGAGLMVLGALWTLAGQRRPNRSWAAATATTQSPPAATSSHDAHERALVPAGRPATSKD